MPRERSRGVWFKGENGSVAVAGLLLNVCGTVMLFFFGFPQRVTTKGAYLLRQRLLRHGGSGLSGGVARAAQAAADARTATAGSRARNASFSRIPRGDVPSSARCHGELVCLRD